MLCYSLVFGTESKCCLIWALAREAEEEGENRLWLGISSFFHREFLKQIFTIYKPFEVGCLIFVFIVPFKTKLSVSTNRKRKHCQSYRGGDGWRDVVGNRRLECLFHTALLNQNCTFNENCYKLPSCKWKVLVSYSLGRIDLELYL